MCLTLWGSCSCEHLVQHGGGGCQLLCPGRSAKTRSVHQYGREEGILLVYIQCKPTSVPIHGVVLWVPALSYNALIRSQDPGECSPAGAKHTSSFPQHRTAPEGFPSENPGFCTGFLCSRAGWQALCSASKQGCDECRQQQMGRRSFCHCQRAVRSDLFPWVHLICCSHPIPSWKSA